MQAELIDSGTNLERPIHCNVRANVEGVKFESAKPLVPPDSDSEGPGARGGELARAFQP